MKFQGYEKVLPLITSCKECSSGNVDEYAGYSYSTCLKTGQITYGTSPQKIPNWCCPLPDATKAQELLFLLDREIEDEDIQKAS